MKAQGKSKLLIYAAIAGAMVLGIHLLAKKTEPASAALPQPGSPIGGGASGEGVKAVEPKPPETGEVYARKKTLPQENDYGDPEENRAVPGLNPATKKAVPGTSTPGIARAVAF